MRLQWSKPEKYGKSQGFALQKPNYDCSQNFEILALGSFYPNTDKIGFARGDYARDG